MVGNDVIEREENAQQRYEMDNESAAPQAQPAFAVVRIGKFGLTGPDITDATKKSACECQNYKKMTQLPGPKCLIIVCWVQDKRDL